jgi:hypothetical protein
MTQRFLAFLLFGVLALTALDGFEQQQSTTEQSATTAAPTDDGEVRALHGTSGFPPG